MIGLSGPNEESKKELAIKYSEENGAFLLNLSRDDLYLATERESSMAGQIRQFQIVLEVLDLVYSSVPTTMFVTTMTPIDVLANMYNAVQWCAEPSSECEQEMEIAWKSAVKIMNNHLSVLMHLQPSHDPAPMSKAEQLNYLTVGMIHSRMVNLSTTKMFLLPRHVVDLNIRLGTLKQLIYGHWEKKSPYQISSTMIH